MNWSRVAHWEAAGLLVLAALGFWVAVPSLVSASVAGVLGLISIALALWPRRLGPILASLATLGGAIVAFQTSSQVRRIESDWPGVHEDLIESASQSLEATLSSAVEFARSLADSAASVGAGSGVSDRESAFRRLEGALATDGPEGGVVALDGDGQPWAWAGRHRLVPELGSANLSARITQFYVILEARRQRGSTTGVGQVVLAADSAVPDRRQTLAERFAARTGVGLAFYAPRTAPTSDDVFDYVDNGVVTSDTLFSVQTVPPSQGSFKLQVEKSGGRTVALLILLGLVLLLAVAGGTCRWLGVIGGASFFVLTPAGPLLNLGELFSAAPFFLPTLGPVSGSAGSLLISAALGVIVLVPMLRRRMRSRWIAGTLATLCVVVAPFVMKELAEGITPPATGVGVGLWLGWEGALTVTSAVLLLVAGQFARSVRSSPAPRWTAGVAWCWAVVAGVLGLFIWDPVHGWPDWYPFLWWPGVALAVLPGPTLRTVTSVAVVAGTAAALLTWSAAIDGRLILAERDARRVSEGDPMPMGMLHRFSGTLLSGPVPRTAASLYAAWRRSPLSADGYPVVLATWSPEGREVAHLDLAEIDLRPGLLQALAATARDSMVTLIETVVQPPGVHYVAWVPFPDGSVVSVGVGPRSLLIPPVRVARFLRGERSLGAPYRMFLGEPVGGEVSGEDRVVWERDGWMIHGGRTLTPPEGTRYHLQVQVPIGGIGRHLVRGSLVLLLNVGLIGLLWLTGEGLSGSWRVPGGIEELTRFQSYRTRLTIVLAGFFVLPTLGFAAWDVARLRIDATQRRDLLIQQTLSDAVGSARQLDALTDPMEQRDQLNDLSRDLGADLAWYQDGKLMQTSPGVLAELGLFDRYMQPSVYLRLFGTDALEVTASSEVGGQATRVGYRNVGGLGSSNSVLAAPRLVDVQSILEEEEDLLLGLVLATLLGLTAAAWLAALAARSLAKPVRSLRGAALAIGRGDPIPPFEPGVPTEFVSVVDAFVRMAQDVESSQLALETSRRRTAAVLRNVATGVVALDRDMDVTIANRRAETLLGVPLPAGTKVDSAGGPEWDPVWQWVKEFLEQGGESDSREFTVGEMQVRAQAANIYDTPGGCVVALDDTTELTRAVRVIAWGQLARQIAHEIKNPLTPIRLGIQHLQRAYRNPRVDFDDTLNRTSRQILAEIERLDAIARAFSRFGAPPAEASPLEPADLVVIARDTAELYSLADGTSVRVVADGEVIAPVRKDDVKEVLVNLVENARDAEASWVEISVANCENGAVALTVRDNGHGIGPSDQPRVFEPQFSTTTSGTGLGLAICKRLVESWGGTIGVESEEGKGTVVRIVLQNGADTS
ncbi:MAG: ATP-binding protein [Gemmatimonadales bacterium]